MMIKTETSHLADFLKGDQGPDESELHWLGLKGSTTGCLDYFSRLASLAPAFQDLKIELPHFAETVGRILRADDYRQHIVNSRRNSALNFAIDTPQCCRQPKTDHLNG